MYDNSYRNSLGAGIGLIIIIWLSAIAFGLYMNWRVARKAGYPGAYSLLLFIPLVNLVVLFYFVFTEWPVERLAKMNMGIPTHKHQKKHEPASFK
jgi:hypothetical protein